MPRRGRAWLIYTHGTEARPGRPLSSFRASSCLGVFMVSPLAHQHARHGAPAQPCRRRDTRSAFALTLTLSRDGRGNVLLSEASPLISLRPLCPLWQRSALNPHHTPRPLRRNLPRLHLLLFISVHLRHLRTKRAPASIRQRFVQVRLQRFLDSLLHFRPLRVHLVPALVERFVRLDVLQKPVAVRSHGHRSFHKPFHI